MTARRLLLAVVALSLVVVACDREGGSRVAVPDDNLTFCDNIIDAEDAAIKEDAAGTLDLLSRATRRVPEDIADTMSKLDPLVRRALASEDPGVIFFSDEFRKLDDELDVWVIDNCGIKREELTSVEFSYEDLPPLLWEGRVGFRMTNDGKQAHELSALRIKDGVTETADALLRLPEEELFKKTAFEEALLANPGGSDDEVFDLEDGRYIFACFIPEGTTNLNSPSSGQPNALGRGMYSELTVRATRD